MNLRDESVESPTAIPGWLLGPLLVGAAAALIGGYWDDAWHTERGRDTFFIAPHIAIYGGITVVGGALSWWVVMGTRANGIRAALRHRPLALALLAVGLTLASAPIDNAWHLAFGRDAVIWSPPHALGIVGTAGLGVALLLELAGSRAGWARWARPVAGGFVLAALTFLVVEYETDVPQFDAIWYLPVLGLTSALALAIVRRVDPARWAAGETALAQLAFVVAVSLLLYGLGFDVPRLPLLVVPALVLDAGARRGVPLVGQALAYTVTLFALYVPAGGWVGSDVRLDGVDVLLAFPLTLASVAVALVAVLGQRRPSAPARRGTAAVAGLGALLLFPAGVVAHDPGQGVEAGAVALKARLSGRQVTLSARPDPGLCPRVRQGQLVARRAGVTRRVKMQRTGCSYLGRVTVPQRGRWFVYAELARGGKMVESWIPVKVGKNVTIREPARYAYVADKQPGGVTKAVLGVALYGLMLAMVGAMIALARGLEPGVPADS